MTVFLRAAAAFFIVGLVTWVLADTGHAIPGPYPWDTISFALMGISIALYVLTLLWMLFYKQFIDFGKKGRCTRCGKRVRKGELYCDFHKKEVQTEFLSKRRGEE